MFFGIRGFGILSVDFLFSETGGSAMINLSTFFLAGVDLAAAFLTERKMFLAFSSFSEGCAVLAFFFGLGKGVSITTSGYGSALFCACKLD